MAPTLRCAIVNCKTTSFNKTPDVTFHRFPTNPEMRNKWFRVLKQQCAKIDGAESKICSKHFELKYFDSQKKLRDNAVPTLFSSIQPLRSIGKVYQADGGSAKIDKLLNKMTQADLTANIKANLANLKEPMNLDKFVTDDLKCKAETPTTVQLWLMVKKQEHLNTRLMDLVVQTKKHVEILQKSMEESKGVKKEQEQNIESLKYIVKCLQEKQTTLEEQIEILTAVESR